MILFLSNFSDWVFLITLPGIILENHSKWKCAIAWVILKETTTCPHLYSTQLILTHLIYIPNPALLTFSSSDKSNILILMILHFTANLCDMDITTIKKIPPSNLWVTIKEEKTIPGWLFYEENYHWQNTKTDELLTSCASNTILRKFESNGKILTEL